MMGRGGGRSWELVSNGVCEQACVGAGGVGCLLWVVKGRGGLPRGDEMQRVGAGREWAEGGWHGRVKKGGDPFPGSKIQDPSC